jgi:hypothetical protein
MKYADSDSIRHNLIRNTLSAEANNLLSEITLRLGTMCACINCALYHVATNIAMFLGLCISHSNVKTTIINRPTWYPSIFGTILHHIIQFLQNRSPVDSPSNLLPAHRALLADLTCTNQAKRKRIPPRFKRYHGNIYLFASFSSRGS